MIQIMLVDDHQIFRQGIATLFASVADMTVVAECGEGFAAVQLADKIRADIIVMDISLPDLDGIEAARRILAQNPEARILLLSMHKEAEMVQRAVNAGINGYVLKDHAFDNLIYAIRALLRGERYINLPLEQPAAPGTSLPEPAEDLTPRESEILRQICEGYSSREIAENLFISVKTVETHRARIMEKLGARNVAQLVRWAVKNGMAAP